MWSPYFFGASLAATELRLWSWRSTSVGICASKAALCATGRARTAADTNAVHDRLLQSMRVRFSDSEQWSSPVKPPRSQNYVKPHDARTRVQTGAQMVRVRSVLRTAIGVMDAPWWRAARRDGGAAFSRVQTRGMRSLPP